MPVIYFTPEDQEQAISIDLADNESLLDGLLRHGVDVPYGCKGGVCQSCLMQSSDNIPSKSQQGLREGQKSQGLFLSCCCFPEEGFNAAFTNSEALIVDAQVLDKQRVGEHVIRLRIEAEAPCRPGQFMTLHNGHGIARSYSVANIPDEDGFIEFHIKHIANGAFSDWAWQYLEAGHSIGLQGPMGECFYQAENKEQPLLLSGIGTGLAPLLAIIRDALSNGHSGKIQLFLGANKSSNFYMLDILSKLAADNNNVSVHCVALDIDTGESSPLNITSGDIYQYVSESMPSLSGYKVFLCGAASFVKKMKRQCFMAGAGMRDIASDPFISFS